MPTQNADEIKEKILSIIRRRGPSLPVHIAGEIKTSILFASAFLSELLSEKKIRISNMKVGSSPLYYLIGQEYLLDRFSQHLKSREKDAYFLLKEKKFLEDARQEPAIRVALRAISDFAKPFKAGGKIIWRYHLSSEEEFQPKKEEVKPIEEHEYVEPKQKVFDKEEREIGEKIIKDIKTEEIKLLPVQKDSEISKEKDRELHIFDKEPPKKVVAKKQPKKKILPKKKDENFFNKVKEFLAKKSMELVDIEEFSKNEIVLRIKEGGREKILIAYNKKKITESEILGAYKKASESALPYSVLCLGEVPKKLENLLKAVKNLSKIDKID